MLLDLSVELDDGVDLNGHIQRQNGDADGRARVLADLGAEDLGEQLRRAVGDLGLEVEVGLRRDEDVDLEHALDAVEVAEGEDERGEHVDDALLRGGLRLLDGDVLADLAELGEGAVGELGEVAAEVELVAGDGEGQVASDGLGRDGQGDSELDEAGSNFGGHYFFNEFLSEQKRKILFFTFSFLFRTNIILGKHF